ncbi:MAG: hypothetical protein ABI275_08835 [Terrimesophilobacter sp.]
MTMSEIASAMLRRWYVLLGLLACAVLVTVMLAHDGGIYTTRTVVSFLRPAGTSLSLGNGTNDPSVIAFAGSVVLGINNGRPPASYSMEDAPYYGAGIRQGALVELSNSGNQWVSSFDKAEIQIQIVGRTSNWVQSKQDELVSKVLSIAESQQAAMAISPSKRITASVVPLTTHIDYVSASRSSQLAAGAAMLTAAMIIGAWGSVTADRLLSRRRLLADTSKSPPIDHTLEGSLS